MIEGGQGIPVIVGDHQVVVMDPFAFLLGQLSRTKYFPGQFRYRFRRLALGAKVPPSVLFLVPSFCPFIALQSATYSCQI